MPKTEYRITLFQEFFTNVDRQLIEEFKRVTGMKRIQNWLIEEFNIQFDYLISSSDDNDNAARILERAHYSKREWVSEKMRNEIKKSNRDEMFMIRYGLRKTCVNGESLVYQRNPLLSKKCKEEIGYWDIENSEPMTFKTCSAADQYCRTHFSVLEGVEIFEMGAKNE